MPFLSRALELAHVRRGFTAPNPAVGAVVVRDGKIIGEGYHWAAGQPHAEVEAIRQAGPDAKGADLYVTLEPCSHVGRTPPCTDLIRHSGLRRVVFGYYDPNPRVREKNGLATLREAGVQCVYEEWPGIHAFYQSYSKWTTTGRPWVTLKLALTLDGAFASRAQTRTPITGPALSLLTHQGRKQANAILTTAATVIADDPQLNVRLADEVLSKPIYILDTHFRLPATARLFSTASRVTLFVKKGLAQAAKERGLEQGIAVYPVEEKNEGGLLLSEILQKIGADGVHDLWVEAGGRLAREFLNTRSADRVLFYIAPKSLGELGKSVFEGQRGLRDFSEEFRQVRWLPTEDGEVALEMVR